MRRVGARAKVWCSIVSRTRGVAGGLFGASYLSSLAHPS
jgi:hypothetical protein